jgi:hypothetical protein
MYNLGVQLLIHSHNAGEKYFSEVKLLNEANSKFKERRYSTKNAQKQREYIFFALNLLYFLFLGRVSVPCSIYQHV